MSRGEVVFAASNQRIDRLGHSLVRAGALSLEQLRDAERGYRRGERFGKALVERGLLTPRELWSGLQRQVEEIVRSLFSYRAGLVYFWDGDVQPDNVVRLELPTQRIRVDDLPQLRDLPIACAGEQCLIDREVPPATADPTVGTAQRPRHHTASGLHLSFHEDILEVVPKVVYLCHRLLP